MRVAVVLDGVNASSGPQRAQHLRRRVRPAALLCERLGDAHVTTIDIGPELTALARATARPDGSSPRRAASCRDAPTRPGTTRSPSRNASDEVGGFSPLDPQTLYADSTFGLLAQTRLAGVVSRLIYVDDDENLGAEMATGDGASWALVHHTRDEQHGYRTFRPGRASCGTRSRRYTASGSRTTARA